MVSANPDSNDSTSKGVSVPIIANRIKHIQGENCKHLKELYDQCFNNWFKHDFLKGNFNDECKLKLKEYRACLKKYFEKKGNNKLVEMIKKFDR